MTPSLALIAAALLALTHAGVHRLQLTQRGLYAWKAAAGGVAISYAFLVVLPKLASAQNALEKTAGTGVQGFLAHHSYVVALFGLTCYYSLDVVVDRLMLLPDRRVWRPAITALTVIHVGSLSGYYFLVGYLLGSDYSRDLPTLALFTVAMLVHFLALDDTLDAKYGKIYDRVLRWLFVVATLGGTVLARITDLSFVTLALLNSLFAGILIIATIKEKVPSGSRARVWPFVAGAAINAALLLLVESLRDATR